MPTARIIKPGYGHQKDLP
uniref:Uncharacterized protein n=1 Tax=Pyricularia oryzae (strain 70-15 / ATCC MYA-4617 / FGSC 8958) TaxID=242507 RepID=Q2KFQ9_PYRO7|nr:hypothetical protein MGCH7_ch7g626 [Pyricularia oryzae 70-15]